MANVSTAFTPDWVSPPGDTILDLLEERGWNQAEFAIRTGYTTKHISQLINGKVALTEDAALKLERVLGSPASFWLTREAHYREGLARAEERISLAAFAGWLKEIPVRDMINFGWIRSFADKGEMVAECLRFFGVASVSAWQNEYGKPVAAYRSSEKFAKHSGAVSAWLRGGERQSAMIVCEPYNKTHFKETLLKLRALTTEPDPEIFIPKLTEVCAAVGVAVVVTPAPKGCPVSGATKWVGQGKALLMLSLRHKTNDHFWFSFFHEAGHLLLHGKKLLFIDVEGDLGNDDEEQANTFARDLLIPPPAARMLNTLSANESSIRNFATEHGIAPGIVIGRLQNEKRLPWNSFLNKSLKVRYVWAHEG